MVRDVNSVLAHRPDDCHPVWQSARTDHSANLHLLRTIPKRSEHSEGVGEPTSVIHTMVRTYCLLFRSLAVGRAAVVSMVVYGDTGLAKLTHIAGRLLDVAHLILLTHAVYEYAVTNFGRFEALARPPEYVLVVEIFLDPSDR